jgi:hypothetical protein
LTSSVWRSLQTKNPLNESSCVQGQSLGSTTDFAGNGVQGDHWCVHASGCVRVRVCGWVCQWLRLSSGSAKDLGKLMAHPGPHGPLPQSHPSISPSLEMEYPKLVTRNNLYVGVVRWSAVQSFCVTISLTHSLSRTQSLKSFSLTISISLSLSLSLPLPLSHSLSFNLSLTPPLSEWRTCRIGGCPLMPTVSESFLMMTSSICVCVRVCVRARVCLPHS